MKFHTRVRLKVWNDKGEFEFDWARSNKNIAENSFSLEHGTDSWYIIQPLELYLVYYRYLQTHGRLRRQLTRLWPHPGRVHPGAPWHGGPRGWGSCWRHTRGSVASGPPSPSYPPGPARSSSPARDNHSTHLYKPFSMVDEFILANQVVYSGQSGLTLLLFPLVTIVKSNLIGQNHHWEQL